MILRFSPRTAQALVRAYVSARSYQLDYIGTEHLLAGIVYEGEGPAYESLHEQGLTRENYTRELARVHENEPQEPQFDEGIGVQQILKLVTPRTKRVFELAAHSARRLGLQVVEPEHLLLGIIQEGDSVAIRLLAKLGVDPRTVFAYLARRSGADRVEEPDENEKAELERINRELDKSYGSGAGEGGERGGKSSSPNLDKYSIDLTEMARNHGFDPIIGRDVEISRVVQILARRTKNNPVLIGEPGVGKTAIAYGLAERIIADDAPDFLRGKRLVSLDLSGMLAGAKYRGEFEERLKNVINEGIALGNVMFFIDELHTIIGAGAAEGAMDAANILKPLLTRGELQIIGATTIDEYHKHVEKDAALERRFQTVMVGEPNEEETIQILKGIRDKFEAHHRVRITDEAITAATRLGIRFITDRYLPDKAIDLIDEGASRLRIQASAITPETRDLQARLDAVAAEKKEAADREDFERAAELRRQEQELEEKLAELEASLKHRQDCEENVLDADDIAEIVAQWTGIPVQKVTEDETEKLRGLESELKKRVIGQDEAVTAVSKAIRRARLGLKDPKRPTGSYIFLGTTGVGKTELARALAEVMFGDEQALIRVDMSEYMEKFDVSKLIGSPPGYVGYDEGGQLTERVRRRPYSVILFDEIEKAHPDVFNALLQILEDGRMTDGQGRTVDFKNTIIIMTSNIGARLLTTPAGRRIGFGLASSVSDESGELYGGKNYEEAKALVMEELKKTFNPEFINRVDGIIFFHMLDHQSMLRIADIMLRDLERRLAEIGIGLEVSEDARRLLVQRGYDPVYGARPLRREIQTSVEDRVSEAMLDGIVTSGQTAYVDVDEGEIVVTNRDVVEAEIDLDEAEISAGLSDAPADTAPADTEAGD
ncbi:MAG: ATP-dependent Clp protease ATP-binding subunit [Bacillota bacterium]|nr:ATP-dependent Clp protease ATP-binding subunit [Bacillota bacterium]